MTPENGAPIYQTLTSICTIVNTAVLTFIASSVIILTVIILATQDITQNFEKYSAPTK
jgi:hypothetical protein